MTTRKARLRHRVTIERNTPQTRNHEKFDSWQKILVTNAERFDPRGNEIVEALQTRSVMTSIFRVPYSPDISPVDRLVDGERVYDIKAVTDMNDRQRWLLIHCQEHTSHGD